MTCEEFRDASSAFLDGELAPDERAACEAHLSACAGCRRETEGLAGISGRLREWQEPGAPDSFEASLAVRIAAAARPKPALPGRFRLLAACVASFLLGSGLTYGLATRTHPPAPASQPKPEASQPRRQPQVEIVTLAPSIWRLPPKLGQPRTAEGPKVERIALAPSRWPLRESIAREMKRRNGR